MAWSIDVGGTDITSIAQSIVWRPKLSRPASCVVRFPSNLFSASTGISEMHLYNGSLLFSGKVWHQEQDGTEDVAYTTLTAYDHLIYLGKRMCKTPQSFEPENFPEVKPPTEPGPCNLADPNEVLYRFVTAPAILAEFIQATNDCDGACPIGVGSVAGGGVDMTGFPSDWPMDIGTFANILLETGQLDIVVIPGFGSSTVNLYNGTYGTNRTGSVNFQYGTGAFNSRGANRTSDMEDLTNALWYLLGPKMEKYEGDISHWRGSLTPSGAHDQDTWVNPIEIDGYPGPSHPWHQWPGGHVSRWTGSRSTYGYMQEIQIHDTKEDENKIRFLFERMYANEAYIRAVPRTFVSSSPDRSTAAPSFFVGDQITISSGSMLGGGFSGSQRVYAYEYSIDADGLGEITEIEASADQE